MSDPFMFESSLPGHVIVRSIACILSDIDPKDLESGLNREQYKRYLSALNFIEQMPIQYREKQNE